MHDAVHFTCALWFKSCIANTTCLTVNPVIVWLGREEFLLGCLFDWLEVLPKSLGDATNKYPLLLEGLLQARVSGLRVLVRHPDQCQDPPPLSPRPSLRATVNVDRHL